VIGALAFAACEPRALSPDAGSGSTGTGGMYICAHGPTITSCSPSAGVPVTSEPPSHGSPCIVEGARCEGTRCYDARGEGPFVITCCGGQWLWDYDRACPTAPQPGDPFVCGPDLDCAAYQTYCSVSNADDRTNWRTSCQPLCAAADCTCFCDNPEACEFQAPGSDCPGDRCTCSTLAALPAGAGVIQVQCDYVVHDNGACTPNESLDGQCAGLKAIVCEGPAFDRTGGGCIQLPDLATNASCGTEVHEYCCPN